MWGHSFITSRIFGNFNRSLPRHRLSHPADYVTFDQLLRSHRLQLKQQWLNYSVLGGGSPILWPRPMSDSRGLVPRNINAKHAGLF